MLRTDLASVGNLVDVALGEGTVPAQVDELPIYDTQKAAPEELRPIPGAPGDGVPYLRP